MEVANFCAAMDTLIDQDELALTILFLQLSWLHSLIFHNLSYVMGDYAATDHATFHISMIDLYGSNHRRYYLGGGSVGGVGVRG